MVALAADDDGEARLVLLALAGRESLEGVADLRKLLAEDDVELALGACKLLNMDKTSIAHLGNAIPKDEYAVRERTLVRLLVRLQPLDEHVAQLVDHLWSQSDAVK